MYFVYVIFNEQVAEVLHITVNTEISNDKTKVLCVRVIIMFFNENVPALAATLQFNMNIMLSFMNRYIKYIYIYDTQNYVLCLSIP